MVKVGLIAANTLTSYFYNQLYNDTGRSAICQYVGGLLFVNMSVVCYLSVCRCFAICWYVGDVLFISMWVVCNVSVRGWFAICPYVGGLLFIGMWVVCNFVSMWGFAICWHAGFVFPLSNVCISVPVS